MNDHLKNQLLQMSPQDKRRLAARLLRERSGEAFAQQPLSHNQRALYLLHQVDPHSTAYHVTFALRILEAVDVDAMRRACQALVDRHPLLRTRIVQVDGDPMQAVQPSAQVAFEHLDLCHLDAAAQRQRMAQAYGEPFDIAAGSLARFYLVTLGRSEHVWLPVVHHIAIDGQSILVVLQEVGALYREYTGGGSAMLPLLAAGYDDFVQAQRALLDSPRGAQLEAFWRQRLAGPLPVLDLPTDLPRPAVRTSHGQTLDVAIGPELTELLKQVARGHGVTLFTLLLAAFQVLLHRHSGQDDIIVGCPDGSRPHAELHPVVGYFVNPVPVRADLSGNPAFGDFLRTLGRGAAEAFAHRELPFAVLVERLAQSRAANQTPLFQAAFNFLQMVHQKELEDLFSPPLPGQAASPGQWGGMAVLPFPMAQQEGQFDLVLDFFEARGALFGTLKFNTDLFHRATLVRWRGHFARLLQGIAEHPEQPIGTLALMDDAERALVLHGWNATRTAYPREATLHALFEAQAERRPHAVALVADQRSMAYAELDHLANQLARRLRDQGMEDGARVALFLERGIDFVVAVLAVLKAGGAYVPLAVNYPAARLQLLLDDTAPAWLLTCGALAGRLPAHGARTLRVEDEAAATPPVQPAAGVSAVPAAGAEALAYVMHTSGSTGGPKGVMVSHRNIVRLVCSTDYMQLDEDTAMLMFAAVAFDASTLEIWGPLLNGGRIVVAPPGLASCDEIGRIVERDGANSMFLSTALFHQWVAQDPPWMARMRHLLVGGELVSAPSVARLLRGPAPERLSVVYGPTENTTFSTAFEVPRGFDAAQLLPIGRPIANSRAHIVDAYGNPTPIGIAGELRVGGDGVALGYLNRPELSAQKFVPDPWSGEPGARLYCTGDRARTLADGHIEFLGRLDRQVKLRGFRIELPEIEQALSAQPGVSACAVVLHTAPSGDRQLAAYFVPSATPVAARELRRALLAQLPDYMVPAFFVAMDALPVSAHGKIDQAALPAPGSDAGPRGYRAPASPREEILCGLWADLLQLPQVGVDDNFFELGGHSLLSMRLAARLRDTFGVEIPLARLFDCATPAAQAALLDGAPAALPPLVAEPASGCDAPQSPAQAGLWFLDRFDGPSSLYNIPLAFTLHGPVDLAALEAAVNDLLARHDALRTVFLEQDGKALARCRPHEHQPLEVLDADYPGGDAHAHAVQRLREQALRPFDLSADAMLRMQLLRLAPQEHLLLLVIHHIVADGWSTTVFCEELGQRYAAHRSGRAAASPLAPLPIQYADYARWQAAQRDAPLPQLDYWRRHLQGAPVLLDLPTDRPRPAVQRIEGATWRFTLPKALHLAVAAVARRQGATLFMALQAAFACLLSRQTGSDDIVLGTPVAHRPRTELQGLVGLFVDLLVLRTRIEPGASFADVLAQVRTDALAAHAQPHVPFDRLVDALQPERSTAHSPLVQVLFQLENAPPAPLALDGLRVQPLPLDAEAAKFDIVTTLVATDKGLEGRIEYRSSLFDEASIASLATQYRRLLEGIAADPARPVATLDLLDDPQRAQLRAFGDGAHGLDLPATPGNALALHQQFEAQVRRTPHAPAVSCAGRTLSYQALERHANRLAWRLREQGIGLDAQADHLVGLFAERGLELVVGILGILKAGGCYVPLDPAYPAERLAFMAQDAALTTVVLGRSDLRALWPGELPAVPVAVDLQAAADTACDTTPPHSAAAERLAYVIYTSGSTGQPKGVMVEHRQVTRLFEASRPWFNFGPEDVWTLFHSYAFDFSVWELWGALLHGGRLVVVPQETSRTPRDFLALLEDEGVTVLNQTPSAFRQLVAADAQRGTPLPALRYVVFGGEALDLPSVREWMQRHGDQAPQLVNMYGITETTVHVSCRPLALRDLAGASTSPIGRPLADLQIHVLDAALQPVPPGVIGEMYVGGAGLARGYLHRPELTRERFIPDPLSGRPGARLYRTGDLARWRAGGELEYLGRRDQQVKIRGFRIEPGEIEIALMAHPALQAAVVQAWQAAPGDTRLAAWAVPRPGQAVATELLREHLAQRLPGYMVPAAFVLLPSLPLTPSGKIDRRALPAPGADRPELAQAYAAPVTPGEQMLAQVWAQVLKLPRVGIDDNFFELGGDSILSIEILARAAQGGLVLSLQDLFMHQTVRSLARHAGSAAGAPPAAGPAYTPFSLVRPADRQVLPPDLEDAYPLAALQAGMVFHTEQDASGAIYHDLLSLHLEAPHDPAAMREALDRMAARHPALRTAFELSRASQPLQYVHRSVSIPLHLEDWRGLDEAAQEARLAQWLAGEQRRRFDWRQAPLARMSMRRRAEGSFELTLSVHHAVMDGWSAATFYAELLRDYLARVHALPGAPSAEPAPYAHFVALEQAAMADGAAAAFWARELEGARLARLPRDGRVDAAETAASGLDRTVPVPIPADLSDALKRLAAEAGLPLKSLLLTAHLVAQSLITGEQDLVSGLVANGRPETPGAAQSIGLFLNTLPLRHRVAGAPWLEMAREVAAQEQALLAHRRYPLAEMQRGLGGALFESVFNFIHFHVLKDVFDGKGLRVLRERGHARSDLPLAAEFTLDVNRSEALTLRLAANDAGIGDAQLALWAQIYGRTLEAIARDPRARPDERQILPADEWRRVTVQFARGPRTPLAADAVHERITAMAGRSPHAIALEDGERRLGYAQLEARASRLAQQLVRLGVGAETLVALGLERGIDAVVAMLAVLKAGGAYLPLDLAHPPQRLAFMLQDAAPLLVLTQQALLAKLPGTGVRQVCLDRAGDLPAVADPAPPLQVPVQPGQLAYVIYTSGSTGQPKGVAIEHAAMRNMVAKLAAAFGVAAEDRVLQFAAPGFDAAVAEIFFTLCQGATLVMAPPQDLLAGAELAQRLRDDRITLATLPPSALASLPDNAALDGLRTLIVAGEALPAALATRWARGRRLINAYGPTEGAVGASNADYPGDGTPPPIGRPFANVDIFVLGAQLQVLPAGAIGEICIGGRGLARGYLGQPALTAERFVPSPLNPGERLYRTGDRGRWRSDGQLEFMGRIDDQVKLRGFRIEPGEVEAALLRHAAIRECVVVVRSQEGTARLVACLAADAQSLPALAGLRRALAQLLPDYMVPAVFECVDALPRTVNGKFDRAALALAAPPGARELQRDAWAAPDSPTQALVAGLWAQVLGLARVGAHDNFFELGGDSILSIQLVSRLREAGLAARTRMVFDHPRLADLAQALDSAGPAQDLAVTAAPAAAHTLPPGVVAQLTQRYPGWQDAYPLTPLQQGLLFESLARDGEDSEDGEAGLYFEQMRLHLRGEVDGALLQQAFDRSLQRHDALRAAVLQEGLEAPLQVIRAPMAVPWAGHDWRGLDGAAFAQRLQALLAQQRATGFDFSRDCLMRLDLVRRGERDWLLVLHNHHLLMDGWSAAILLGEVFATYRALRRGAEPALPPAPSYRAYLDWLAGRDRGAAEAHWAAYLADREANAGLGLAAPVGQPSGRGETVLRLPAEAGAALQAWARGHGLTLNTVCTGAWALLLSRYGRSRDVVFGITQAVRPAELAGAQAMVGLLINTVPARVRVDESDATLGLVPWLSALQARQATGLEHGWLPLPAIRRLAGVAPGSPWFDSLVVFENYPVDASLAGDGDDGMFALTGADAEERTQYPLALVVQPGRELELRLVHDRSLLDDATVQRLARHLGHLLGAMAAHGAAEPLSRLEHLDAAERRQLLVDFNATGAPLPGEQCLHQGFEQQARRTPEAVALVDGHRRLSYRELDERANHLAWALQARGVGPDGCVGLYMQRGAAMVVAILGILKAGGAYVPLDPAYPAERIAYITGHARPLLVVTDEASQASLPGQLPALCFDASLATPEPPPCAASGRNLAYVMYTSGSTGRPKGVALEHRSGAALMGFASTAWSAQELAGVLFSTSVCFDLSVYELFVPLWNGGKAIIAQHALELPTLPAAGEVTLINTVPSALNGLLNLGDLPPGLRTINMGGELLPHALARRVYAQPAALRLVNLYGPTEDTVYSTWGSATGGDPANGLAPPIGRPLANRRAYVLDGLMRPQPLGVAGELYLGGAGLARGYLHQPELTDERFVPSPFDAGERLYRTGDLARWREDGNLDYIGRTDHQVKLRGFRIELGEIEDALCRHPGVRHAAVLLRGDPGAQRLVAYVVAQDAAGGTDPAALRTHLAASLPDYMLPAAWVAMAGWPLTPNGKLDRAALPDPRDDAHAGAPAGGPAARPRNGCEAALLAVWAEVLRQPPAGIHDDFFALGGDSISALQAVGKSRQAGWVFTVRQLFEHPSVSAMAQALQTPGAEHPPVPALAAGAAAHGAAVLTPIQHWFFEQRQPEAHHFNQALLLETRERLQLDHVRQALHHLARHHQALSVRYRTGADADSGAIQVQLDPAGAHDLPVCESLDLSALADADLAPAIEAASAEAQAGLDLQHGPLVRALLIDLGPARPGRLLLAIHHLAVDWVSWWMLMDDLGRAMAQLASGQPVQLPPATTRYSDWAAHLARHAASPAAAAEIGFWRSRLPLEPLPLDHQDTTGQRNTVASAEDAVVSLTAEETRLLTQRLPEQLASRVDDILVTALAQAHAAWTGQQVLQIDVENHGRQELDGSIDLSRTVGWFTTLYPVQVRALGDGALAQLRSVEAQLRQVPRRGIGWGVLRYLHPDSSVRAQLAALPLSPYSFNYLGHIDQGLPPTGLFGYATESPGAGHSPQRRRTHLVELNSFVTGGQYQARFTFNRHLHQRAGIEALATHFIEALRGLLHAGAALPAGIMADSHHPLTPLQQGLLFHCLGQPGTGLYVVQQVFTLQGALSLPALQAAWTELLARHPVLRTRFEWHGLARPRQQVQHAATLQVQERDWRTLPPERQAEELEALLHADRQHGHDLAQAPLLRVVLARTGHQTWQMVHSHHHLLLDGWSSSLLLGELFALLEGQALPPPARPFSDYLAWLDLQKTPAARDATQHYWSGELAGLQAATPLPVLAPHARPDGAAATARAVTLEHPLGSEDGAVVAHFLRSHGLTWSTLARAAWALLLGAHASVDDVVFGAVVSGRPAELEGAQAMLGMFVATLPVRVRIAASEQVLPWLRGIQAQQARQSGFEASALSDIQPLAGLPPGQALFQTLLVVENYPVNPLLMAPDRALRIMAVQSREQGDLPLTALLLPGQAPVLALNYDTACCSAADAERLLAHWAHCLTRLASAPQALLGDLDLLPAAQRQRMLVDWNGATKALPPGCVHALFEQQVLRTPEQAALRFQGRELSYRQVDGFANALAQRLCAQGAGPERRVGLFCGRRLEMVVGMLAILKAGAAYLPLDPAYPPDRLRYMVEDAGLTLLLVQPEVLASLPQSGVPVVDLVLDASQPAPPETPVAPHNPAYLIYTSGSTGRPKGVVLEHRGAVNLALALRNMLEIGPGTRVLQYFSLGFDAATWEVLQALCSGATLCLAPADELLPGQDLARLLRTEQIHIATLPPSALAAMAAGDFPQLHTLIAAGEACPAEVVDRWAPGRRFINAYGPTETTVCATWGECHAGAGRPGIGRPLPNTTVYLLDAQRRPVPLGSPGELYVGGAGVARGYHGQPGLTARHFIADPFSAEAGARLYRTGDLCRWRPDGQLDYLGRIDGQLKVRGYRVEPGEIENLLLRQPGVSGAAVVGRSEAGGATVLAAYAVPQDGTSLRVEALREALRAELPGYMVPTQWMVLDALPLSPNGKIDHRALPEPPRHAAPPPGQDGPAYGQAAPAAALIADLFAAVLERDSVGLDEDFFALGGHSLLAVQVQWRVREVLGTEMPLRTLFDAPTPRALGQRIGALGHAAMDPPPPLLARRPLAGERTALSFGQERFYFLDRLEPGSAFYNGALPLRLSGPLDVAALESALLAILARHEVLRSVFPDHDGQPFQQVRPAPAQALRHIDLRTLQGPAQQQALQRAVQEAHAQPADLARGPLVHFTLIALAPQDHVLLAVFHHSVFDGWSAGVFLRELAQGYERHGAQPAPAEPSALPVQYADYAQWQRDWMQGPALQRGIDWWRAQLAGIEPLRLPTDRLRPALQGYRGGRVPVQLPPALVRALQVLGRAHGATLYMTLLASFKMLLYRSSGQTDLVVGTPVAGRSRAEVQGLIGCFINLLALRTTLSGELLFTELLTSVRSTTLDAYAHQDIPFEVLVHSLAPQRDASRSPVFQAMFTLQNLPAVPQGAGFGGLTVSELPLDSPHALYDLSLTLEGEGVQGMGGEFEYNADLFDGATVQRMAQHWLHLLQEIAADAARPIAVLPLFGAAERARLLSLGDGGASLAAAAVSSGAPASLHESFEAQALRAPDALAITGAHGADWTYAELDRRADQLAWRLAAQQLAPGETVALCLERSPQWVMALLAVLKAGGAYLPLDTAAPPQRLAALLADSGARVLLVDGSQGTSPAIAAPGATVIDLAAQAEEIAALPARRLPQRASPAPQQPTSLIYTSGSTGVPKGVQVPHGALLNHALWAVRCYGIGPGDRVLQFASPGFDVVAEEIFPTLIAGAALVLRDDAHLAPDRFGPWVHGRGISVLNLPTAFWHSWVDWLAQSGEAPAASPALRLLVVGGERASPTRYAQWCALAGAAAVRWLNAYGPTEATVTATVFDPAQSPGLHPGDGLPIGRPIDGMQAYVLDAHGQPVPAGAPGELALAGAGVALGYWQRPALTAAVFGDDPFARTAQRMYRTGDLCRWRNDGQLEFLGRVDQQLKIRGYRIEPGEIEATLARHPAVAAAAVVACEVPGQQDARLVACLVAHAALPGADHEAPDLRAWLQTQLPEYMVPSQVIWLPSLPLTTSGKVALRALQALALGAQAPEAEAPAAHEAAAPRDRIESALAALWSELLGVSPVGLHDDFFLLGGHSLLALRAVALIRQRLGCDLPLASLFQGATVASVAARLRAAGTGQAAAQADDAPVQVQTLHAGGEGVPVFFVAPPASSALSYAALARHMGGDRPLHVLVAHRLDHVGGGTPDLPQLAAAHVAAVRQVQPHGPYLVGGWSLGGVLAFEIARQLQAAGEQVRRLVLIDSIAPHASPNPYRTPDDPVQLLAQLVAVSQAEIGHGAGATTPASAPEIAATDAKLFQQRLALHAAHLEAAVRYAPPPLAAAIAVLRAQDKPAPGSLPGLPDLLHTDDLGWGRYSLQPVAVQSTPGDHQTMLREPFAATTGACLRALLQS